MHTWKEYFDAYKGEKIDVTQVKRCPFLFSWRFSSAVEGARGSLGNTQECYKGSSHQRPDKLLGTVINSALEMTALPLLLRNRQQRHNFSTIWETELQVKYQPNWDASSYLLKGCNNQLLRGNIHLLRWKLSWFCTISKMLLRSQRPLQFSTQRTW